MSKTVILSPGTDPAESLPNLSAVESEERADLESQGRGHLRSAFEFGVVLDALREKRLYRSTHWTWDAYVRDEWGIGRSVAEMFINLARVEGHLRDKLSDVPALSLNAAKAFSQFGQKYPGQVADFFTELRDLNGGNLPTAKVIQAAVNERLGKPVKPRTPSAVKDTITAWTDEDFEAHPPSTTVGFPKAVAAELARRATSFDIPLDEAIRRAVDYWLHALNELQKAA